MVTFLISFEIFSQLLKVRCFPKKISFFLQIFTTQELINSAGYESLKSFLL
ncbi:MAG: hypothetical protein K0S08_1527 [Gammaproteobacteria bacterium]|jgi:hypothetical protein|nr:hypothetical protein [Gammaproteobacteria bacterium]